MASLREIPGRDVATRLAAHGRSPADLARAMIEDSPRLGSLGAVQVALSKWFSRGYGPPAARIVAAALDVLGRWDVAGAPALPEVVTIGTAELRARLDALDAPHATIAGRAAIRLGLAPRGVAQALSNWVCGRAAPSETIAAALLAELDTEERASAIRLAAIERERRDAHPSAPTPPSPEEQAEARARFASLLSGGGS